MSDSAENKTQAKSGASVKKNRRVGEAFKITGMIVLLAIVLGLLVNAMLVVFKNDYYTTFGRYRLFAIVSDSMEPTIPKGSMIVDTKPTDANEITVGSVITFKVSGENGETLITHRVVEITADGKYITRGDNAAGNDGYRTEFGDVVGVYTGNKCGFFGSLFGFFQSGQGIVTLIIILFIIVIARIVLLYYARTEKRHALEVAALGKCAKALSGVNLRYDNINEITAVMDVLDMITGEPKNRKERLEIEARLKAFTEAENIELPQTPETAALLDNLPAPDTPTSLVAALASGATLRQAEDGQTLVLTTISGGKNILLTPVQTEDGIILCQQGVRLRTDLAPNIEDVGISSMPASPEFFEGQPLKKSVIYPELPQPSARLGSDMISPYTAQSVSVGKIEGAKPPLAIAPAEEAVAALLELGTPTRELQSALQPSAQTAGIDRQGVIAMREKADEVAIPLETYGDNMPVRDRAAKNAYAQYREVAAQLELRQAEELSALLADASPLTEAERKRIEEYKAANQKPKKPRKPRTPEQIAAAKSAAEKRKIAQQAFLSALSPEDRELYMTEQKLSKSRTAAIRRLKAIARDRKLLENLDKE